MTISGTFLCMHSCITGFRMCETQPLTWLAAALFRLVVVLHFFVHNSLYNADEFGQFVLNNHEEALHS